MHKLWHLMQASGRLRSSEDQIPERPSVTRPKRFQELQKAIEKAMKGYSRGLDGCRVTADAPRCASSRAPPCPAAPNTSRCSLAPCAALIVAGPPDEALRRLPNTVLGLLRGRLRGTPARPREAQEDQNVVEADVAWAPGPGTLAAGAQKGSVCRPEMKRGLPEVPKQASNFSVSLWKPT